MKSINLKRTKRELDLKNPHKSRRSSAGFVDAVLSQVAASLPVYLVVIFTTSGSSISNVYLTTSLTFCVGFAVSLSRAWLSGAIAISAGGDFEELLRLRMRYIRTDMAKISIISLGIMVAFFATTGATFRQVLIGYFVCLTGCILDYYRQLNFITGKSREAMKIDMLFLFGLACSFGFAFKANTVDYEYLASLWAVTMMVSCIFMSRVLLGLRPSSDQGIVSLKKMRRGLVFEFATGFGLLQFLYVFAPSISSPSEAADLRLALIVTGPSAVLAQAFTVLGITLIMADPVGRLKRLYLAGGLVFGSTFALSLCLLAASPTQIEDTIGPLWVDIRTLAFPMLLMSLTQGISLTTGLHMRWEGNPDLFVKARLLSLPAIALAPSIGLYSWGAKGCLLGLSIANIWTWLVNGYLLRTRRRPSLLVDQ